MLQDLAIASGLLLVAVWVVYPAVISVLARLRRRTVLTGQELRPRVTVVIATRALLEVVRARVENVLDSDYPEELLDIVIAYDAGSASSITDANWHDDRIMVVPGDAPAGKATALNAGVRAATGDIVVFADAHQRYRRDTISRLTLALRDRAFGAVSGRLELRATRRSLAAAYWSMERRLRRNEALVHSAVGATGAVWAIRREIWKPLPAGVLLDDVYAPMMVVLDGWRVGYAPDAVAVETREPTPNQEFSRKVRTLTGVIQLCMWLPAVVSPLRNPIWAQFVFHKLLRMFTPYCGALIAAWLVVRGVPLLGPTAPLFLAVGSMATIWLMRTRTSTGSKLRQLAIEGTLLQAAVVVAGLNGLRRHWQVWNG